MRSFAERSDTVCVDEPFYAHYLRHSGRQHPMREEVLAEGDPDLASLDAPVVFEKHMAHHLVGGRTLAEMGDFFAARVQALLIRNPREMLPSMLRDLKRIEPSDLGYDTQVQILRYCDNAIVIDSRDLLENPEGILSAFCERLGIPFEQSMLSWKAGRHSSFGVWAPFWYRNVEASTGFLPWAPKEEPFPTELNELLSWALPLYEELCSARLVA
tara:strand:+ start:373 stop:1014 length:642 start_codon:yes stop_codon:yes gene_type:complete